MKNSHNDETQVQGITDKYDQERVIEALKSGVDDVTMKPGCMTAEIITKDGCHLLVMVQEGTFSRVSERKELPDV